MSSKTTQYKYITKFESYLKNYGKHVGNFDLGKTYKYIIEMILSLTETHEFLTKVSRSQTFGRLRRATFLFLFKDSFFTIKKNVVPSKNYDHNFNFFGHGNESKSLWSKIYYGANGKYHPSIQ